MRQKRGKFGFAGGVPEMPRKTLVATVSLPSLTMELLMAWSVVVYVLSSFFTSSYDSVPLGSSHFSAPPMYLL